MVQGLENELLRVVMVPESLWGIYVLESTNMVIVDMAGRTIIMLITGNYFSVNKKT